jgi:hypothetical protein
MDPEYKEKIMQSFYKKVRETKWQEVEEFRPTAARGRKPKVFVRHESVLNTPPQGKYQWFDKTLKTN